MNANGWPVDELVDRGLASHLDCSLTGFSSLDLSSASFNIGPASPDCGSRALPTGAASGSPSYSLLERQLGLGSLGQADLSAAASRDPPAGGERLKFSLSAGTSPAVRINEEPLTYLNQGQAYEVKLTYCPLPQEKPRLLRSVFRVSFHERRMQFMEREHLDYWRHSRPGERILDADAALSYGLRDLQASQADISTVEAVWEGGGEGSVSGSDCGLFLRLHCVSTEFTARKHGGEKGVPIDTSDQVTGEHLCTCAAQVKVFKPKGADRKHKTDREKMERRGDHGGKYQTPLPYTPFLTVAAADSLEQQTAAPPTKQLRQQGPIAISTTLAPGSHPRQRAGPSTRRHRQQRRSAQPTRCRFDRLAEKSSVGAHAAPPAAAALPPPPPPQPLSQAEPSVTELTANCSPRQVADWLRRQRFNTLT
uniref:CP2 domain-containing protein n=1 Tax=Macrostomum lignano TaxID=282301 RepID=A0A1I8GWQ1_9PLAT